MQNPDINNGYYFFELLDIIQCSRQQLQENLKEIRALCLDGNIQLTISTFCLKKTKRLHFLHKRCVIPVLSVIHCTLLNKFYRQMERLKHNL